MKNFVACLLVILTLFLCSLNTVAQQYVDAAPVKTIIAFVIQSSTKLEVIFNKMPANNEKFSIQIADDHSGKEIFDQMVAASSVSKGDNKMIFYVKNLSVDSWTFTDPNLY